MESSAQQIYFYMAVFYFHRESSFSSQPFFFKLETNCKEFVVYQTLLLVELLNHEKTRIYTNL